MYPGCHAQAARAVSRQSTFLFLQKSWTMSPPRLIARLNSELVSVLLVAYETLSPLLALLCLSNQIATTNGLALPDHRDSFVGAGRFRFA
jgi:hypothetical protein